MSEQNECIKCSIDDCGVCLVVLNRPEALNALNLEMFAKLGDLFEKLRVDPKVRGVIVTGEGDKAFAAGTDINMLKDCSDRKSVV